MNPIALFTGPYGLLAKWGVITLLCASLFGYGWVKGNQHGTLKLTEYQGAQAVATVKVIMRQGAATERVVTQYVKIKGATQVVTETIEKEVVKYAESKPLALACLLDNRWLRLHDAAALGTVPPPAAGDDGAAGGIDAAHALPSITSNYARARRNADRLTLCQDWVRQQFEATNGRPLGY